MAHDSDTFNRWDAGQQLGMRYLLAEMISFKDTGTVSVPGLYHEAFSQLLMDEQADPAFLAAALILPSETWISQQVEVVQPEVIFKVRQGFRGRLSRKHRDIFLNRYHAQATDRPYHYSAQEAGRRALRNCCLTYLLCVEPGREVAPDMLQLGLDQYHEADNMTDVSAALAAVVHADRSAGDELLEDFFGKWQDDPLVVDKWLMLQATCILPGTLQRVRELLHHPAFSMKNPNKVRSLIGAFCSNLHQFHAGDGSGYTFLTDRILELDSVNPQIASRLLTPLTQWRRYDSNRQQLMKQQLERIASREGLSRDVAEIVEKSL
jgi:aminopeptidase N